MIWGKKIALLEQQLTAVQAELEKEQGKAARLEGFLGRLHTFGISPIGQIPMAALAETFIDSVHELVRADHIILFRIDPDTQDFVPAASRGFSPEFLSRLRVGWGEGSLGRAARDLKTIASSSAAPGDDLLQSAHLVIPLVSQGRCIGLLMAAKPQEGDFTSDSRRTAAFLAGQAALLLENFMHYEQVTALQEQTIRMLARAIEAKDTITHTHSGRTRALVRAIAQELALPEVLITQIERGALLHDIGKIGIEDAILKKTDQLTPEEYAVMKTHPRIGQRLLEPLPYLRNVGAIVLYHQEWFNGAGYPEGLAGDEIPLGARIVQVIDAWDAMTSNRTYRQAMPKSAAIAELRRQAGTQFDPKIVDLFLRVIDRLEREGIPTTEMQQPAATIESR